MGLFDHLRDDLRSTPEGDPAEELPRALGRYELRGELGRGGMGIVFEAFDPVLKRRVALKILRDEFALPEIMKRFHREATIAAQLKHPNIVSVHEVDLAPDSAGHPRHFIVMDFIEGTTLARILKDRSRSREDLIRMLEEVACAAAFAHEQGVVHRDLKPENVLVDSSGRPLLTDFGLARQEVAQSTMTMSGAVLGTPRYMAPEAIDGKRGRVGPRSDVYALGVMLYEILLHRPPFSAATVSEVFQRVLSDEPDRPRKIDASIPAELEWICLRALEKDPLRRYAAARGFAEDVARFRKGQAVLARPPSWIYRFRKRLATRKLAVVIGAAGLLAVAAVGALLIPPWRRERAQRQATQAQLAREAARRETIEQLGKLWMRTVLAKRKLHNATNEPEKVTAEIRDAVDATSAFVADHPDCPEAHYVQAWGLLYLGELDRAEEALRRCLACEGSFPRAAGLMARAKIDRYAEIGLRDERIWAGTVESHQKLLQEAVGWLQRSDGPSTPWPFERLEEDDTTDIMVRAFQRRFVAGDEEGARGILQDAIQREEAAELCSLLGFLCNDPDQCLEWQTRALKRMPLYAKAYFHRAMCYSKKDDFARTIDDCTQSLRIRPSYGAPFLYRSNARFECGKRLAHEGRAAEAAREWNRALEDASQAIDLNAEDVAALQLRGLARSSLGDREGARRDYERGIEIRPSAIPLYFDLGGLLLDMNEPAAALAVYEKVTGVDSKSALARWGRGDAYLTLNRIDEALADYDAAVQLDPRLPGPRSSRGRALRAIGDRLLDGGRQEEGLGKLDQAVGEFTTAIGLDSSWSDAFQHRAETYSRMGIVLARSGRNREALERFLRAAEDFGRAFALDRSRPIAIFYRGVTYAYLMPLDADRASEWKAKGKADLEETRAKLPPGSPMIAEVERVLRVIAGVK